jgi:cyclophilin family peptidyl-prolyl cis-trans isomerase/HEAT repeat protein
MKNYFYVFILFFIGITACVPPDNNSGTKGAIELTDPVVQEILKYTVAQNEDSLYVYLNHENPNYQLLALRAFASMPDAKQKNRIVEKLNSVDIDISAMAAYVLGQMGDSSHADVLIQSFRGQDSVNVDNIHNHNVLEAIGKTGTLDDAKNIASVTTYRSTDSLLTLGQIRSLYRFCLRGIIPAQSVETALKYLENKKMKSDVRLIAGHILARSKELDLTSHANRLITIADKEQNENIKMAVVSAMGKAKADTIQNRLIQYALGVGDTRTRINAIKALSAFKENPLVLDTLKSLITHPDVKIAETYADLLLNSTDAGIFKRASELLPGVNNGYIRAKLLQTQMKNTTLAMGNSKTIIQGNVTAGLKESKNEYERAELIKVLGHDPYQYLNIMNLTVNTPVERVAKINALQSILDGPRFIAAYKNNYIKVKREIINYFASQMAEGIPEVVAQTASHLRKDNNQAKIILKDSTLTERTLSKLKSPEDLEAILEVNQLEAYLKGETYKAPPSNNYKAINFASLGSRGDSVYVTMKTDKGNIDLVLLPKIAPQTVSAMTELFEKGYFNNKTFHRVVPNFVAQGGCPRGDGSGSLDFTLRTEVPGTYFNQEGYLGMASAGFHTESCQFFITHSPTPHLDGKYTLFGKVLKGMDVVYDINIGDKIIDTFVKK